MQGLGVGGGCCCTTCIPVAYIYDLIRGGCTCWHSRELLCVRQLQYTVSSELVSVQCWVVQHPATKHMCRRCLLARLKVDVARLHPYCAVCMHTDPQHWEGGDVVKIMWLTGSAPAGTVHGRTGTGPVRLSQVTRGQMRRPGRLPYFLFIAPAVVCSDQFVLLLLLLLLL
jgi:hypothetical protein